MTAPTLACNRCPAAATWIAREDGELLCPTDAFTPVISGEARVAALNPETLARYTPATTTEVA